MDPMENRHAADRLAAFVAAARFEDLPPPVRLRARDLLLDFLRVTLLGARTEWGQAVLRLARRLGGAETSTVLAWGDRLDPARAALVNGTFAHGVDWDDTHVGAMLHPGAVVLPAVLAAGEARGATGRDLITAMVLGYEGMIRVGLAIQPSHFRRGFQSTASCGVFGAALGAGKALGLDAARLSSAIGIAASYASGLAAFYRSGSTVKRIHAGKAAEAGVMAALLAESGITAPGTVLEDDAGFFRAYADAHDLGRMFDRLGAAYKIMEVTVKAHACSARLQASVDAAQDLWCAERFPLEDVSEVTVGIPGVIAGRLTHAEPPDVQAAQLSLPFTVALALRVASEQGRPRALGFEDYARHVGTPLVRRIAGSVRCVVDPEIDAATTDALVPSRVTVRLPGSTPSRYVGSPRGSPGSPFTFDEVAERFLASSSRLLGDGRSARVVEAVRRVESLAGIPELTGLCVPDAGTAGR